jgi:hypothetical protein
MTQQLDAMLFEPRTPLTLAADDLAQARVCDGTSQALGGPDVVEYWKSAPYLLNFQRDYELGRKLKDVLLSPPAALLDLLQEAKGTILRKDAFENYQDVPAANARLRALFAETLDIGLWRLLWLPPCMPYAEPRGPFQGIGSVTKALVFSSWHMVPDVIAALCSYEAERRMLGDVPASRFEHSQLYDRVKPLLRFARSSDGRLTGMPVLAWLLPSPSLAFAWDPLEAALRIGQGKPVDAEVLLADASSKIAALLQGLPQGAPSGRPDERWYWAALALLDADTQLPSWCRHRDAWPSAAGEHEHGKSFYDHVSHFAGVAPGQDLGPQPQDLTRILAEMMLAAPGICALRALKRQAPTLTDDDPCLLSAAARIAEGFRTLFNLPETIALLRGDGDDTYWRLVLKYAIDGNLQSLLDEQVHILVEWLGLADHRPEQIVEGVSTALAQAVSLRTARVSIDEFRVTQDTIEIEPFNTRCRFALRFGDVRDDAGSALARAEVVRDAFNSPFRPFILASTSIGQEGLDFHLWCHAVVHWNLPSNPVDLEQREGRVHRYKGHAIRKNIVECYGLESLVGWDGHGDPWEALFAHAAADRRPEESDLTPYWVFERGSARIERRVPVLPYTREVMRLRSLKRGLALYRLVFGQPRQEDLLAYLAGQLDDDAARQLGVHCRISLEPPAPLVPGPLPLPAQAIDDCYPPQNPVCTKR